MRELGDLTGPAARRLPGRAIGLLGLALLLVLLAVVPRSEAAFPGKNGLIAFDSDRSGSSDIFLMRRDGTGAFRPFATAADDSMIGPFDGSPAFAPEGGTLAFESNRGGGSIDIWTVNLDGSGLKDITPGLLTSELDPAWSYDGRLIAFETDIQGDSDIAVVTSDGGNFRILTPDVFDEMQSLPPTQDENPVFGLNGQKIFFQSDRIAPGVPQIYSMNLDGSGVTQLTFPPGQSRDPDISADGSEVLFVSDRNNLGGDNDVYAMNVDGTNPRRVASIAGQDTRPVFSPDGMRVAFTNTAPGAFQSDIMGMNLDTTGLGALSPGPSSDGNPDWQPTRYLCQGEAPTIIGSNADESIVGTEREDVIIALDGADTIKSLGGNDLICGNRGRDIINAGSGEDIVSGGGKVDKLKGGKGGDGIFGGAPGGKKGQPDPDVCFGGKGPDNIKGCGHNSP